MNIEKMKRGLKMFANGRGHKMGEWLQSDDPSIDLIESWCECSVCKQILVFRPMAPSFELMTANCSILESGCNENCEECKNKCE